MESAPDSIWLMLNTLYVFKVIPSSSETVFKKKTYL